MNLIFLGPPGAGKGTQSKKIIQKYRIPQISTGDILRNAKNSGTELGQVAATYMTEGKLVPDEIVNGIVAERLVQQDCKNGFILDGFPRTVLQAQNLDQLLSDKNTQIDAVFNFEVPEHELVSRLTGRRVCKQCGATYHIAYAPPKVMEICDACGGEVMQRADDKESTVKIRLKVYSEQTQPLINFYETKNILTTIPAFGTVESISGMIDSILCKFQK